MKCHENEASEKEKKAVKSGGGRIIIGAVYNKSASERKMLYFCHLPKS